MKIRNNIRIEKEMEALKAENYLLKAQLDYIAMMAEIDIPEEDEVNKDVEKL